MSACNCTTSFDLRVCCYPPSSAMACKFGSDDLGWYKYLGHEDNWEHCPVRVDTAQEHFVNSRCLYDRQSGHNEAKWREASALIGLTEAETEAVIAMQFHESESDESSDDEDCDVVAEDDGSLHVVPASGLGEGPGIADYDAVSLFPSAMGEQHCGDEEDENFDEYGHCKHCGWFPELMHSHVRHAMHISCVYISEKYDLSEYDPDMETAPLHEECSE